MADPNFKKISDMAALTTAAADDIIPIVDVSEAADANKNKKITTANLRKNITNAELAGSITAAKIAGISSDPNADRIVFWDDSATSLAYLAPSTGLQIIDTAMSTKDSEIVHDNLSGFVADEHVAHAGVSITAGTGLSGGGTIAASRTIDLNHLGIEDLTDPGGDRIAFWDDTAGAMKWLTAGSGLAIAGTTLNAANIGSVDIADGAVTTAKIADDAVTSAKIASKTIVAGDIADNTITALQLAAGSVGSSEIANGSIDRVHLAADIVDGTKIANDSINSEHYVDGSIDTAHIGNGQVTNAKLGNDVGTWTTWTPTVTYGGGTTDPTSYEFSYAYYARINDCVFYMFLINITRGSGNRTVIYLSSPTSPSAMTTVGSGVIDGALLADKTIPPRVTVTTGNKISVTLPSAMTGSGWVAGSGFYKSGE